MKDDGDEYIELDFMELEEDAIEPMLDDDEISSGEAGFLQGYYEAS